MVVNLSNVILKQILTTIHRLEKKQKKPWEEEKGKERRRQLLACSLVQVKERTMK